MASSPDCRHKRKRARSSLHDLVVPAKRDLTQDEATFIDQHGNLYYKVDETTLPTDECVQEWYQRELDHRPPRSHVYFLHIQRDHRNCVLEANDEITVRHCASNLLWRCKIDSVQTRPFSTERGYIILSGLVPVKAKSPRQAFEPCPNGLEKPTR